MKTTALKKIRPLATSIALTIAALSSAAIAVDAKTSPVGFIKEPVAGTAYTFVGPTLTGAVQFRGLIDTGGGASIDVAEATPWAAAQYDEVDNSGGPVDPGILRPAYYVEVLDGAAAGTRRDITTTPDSNTVNLASSLGASPGDTFRIVKHNTLGSVFGVDTTPLDSSDSDATTADEVLIITGGSFITYWHYDDLGGNEQWLRVSDNQGSDNVPINPDNGVAVQRKVAGTANLIVTGTVKTGITPVEIYPGYTTVQVNSVTATTTNLLTFGNSGLNGASGVLDTSDSDATGADEVGIFTGGTFVFYWPFFDGVSTYEWYETGNEGAGDQSAVQLPPGTSLQINRKAPGAQVTWNQPAPVAY